MITLRSEYGSPVLGHDWTFFDRRSIAPSFDPNIRADQSLHIASLPRHRGLLQKIMSLQSKTLSIPLKGEFWRPTSNWTNYRSEYSRFMVKNADRKSGLINSKVSRVLYSTPLCVTMMRAGLPPRASGYASLSFPTIYLTNGCRHGF
jgi:hypothetical protein